MLYEGYLYGHICSVNQKFVANNKIGVNSNAFYVIFTCVIPKIMLETILIGETGLNLILLLHLLYAYPHEMLYVCVCVCALSDALSA